MGVSVQCNRVHDLVSKYKSSHTGANSSKQDADVQGIGSSSGRGGGCAPTKRSIDMGANFFNALL